MSSRHPVIPSSLRIISPLSRMPRIPRMPPKKNAATRPPGNMLAKNVFAQVPLEHIFKELSASNLARMRAIRSIRQETEEYILTNMVRRRPPAALVKNATESMKSIIEKMRESSTNGAHWYLPTVTPSSTRYNYMGTTFPHGFYELTFMDHEEKIHYKIRLNTSKVLWTRPGSRFRMSIHNIFSIDKIRYVRPPRPGPRTMLGNNPLFRVMQSALMKERFRPSILLIKAVLAKLFPAAIITISGIYNGRDIKSRDLQPVLTKDLQDILNT